MGKLRGFGLRTPYRENYMPLLKEEGRSAIVASIVCHIPGGY